MAVRESTTKGFKRSGTLLSAQIRKGSESRGFAVSRVVTHWPEIAGKEIAAISTPVKVGYGRQGLGATLTVLTSGVQAPMLEMQKETLRARVNAAYGYNAIARILITQTAPTGFSEGQARFNHRPDPKPPADPSPGAVTAAKQLSHSVEDDGLRQALEQLGKNVLSKTNT